jgi:signal transduction histidine kinase
LQAGAHGSARLEFAGHHWLVVATPGPAFVQEYRTWVPWLGLSLLITFGLVLSGVLSERISARKSVEDERQKTLQALRDAQAANDSKSYFMAAAAHDIKQPLYALGMLVDTLVMSDSRAATMPIVQNLKQGVAQMSEHFDSLMDVGKFHDGNFEVTRSLFQLGDFSARIDIEIAPLCESKGLRWYLDMADVWVFTDEELLLRLFRNLLTNAVTYTVAGEISCSARVKDGVVWFSISDTGVGIAEELQVAVFEKFVRLEKSGIGAAGLGLGLSIVEKINKALDLGLKMNSTPGMGTRFTFRLPKVH